MEKGKIVIIENTLNHKITEAIKTEMQELPSKLMSVLDKSLKTIRISPKIKQDISYYLIDSQEICINIPFDLPVEVFLEMDKKHDIQLELMNIGGYLSLGSIVTRKIHEPNVVILNALKKCILDLSKQFEKSKKAKKYLKDEIQMKEDFVAVLESLDCLKAKKMSNTLNVEELLNVPKAEELLDLLFNIDFPGYNFIGGGRNNINCKEKLLPWTIRHEIGHAVDELLKWTNEKVFVKPCFGGWIYYNSYESMVMEGLKASKLSEYPLESFVFQFINNNGCKVQKDGRSFMLDGYGQWCSYLTASREKAVSNYQYSSARDWFAEAFAAYYGPNHEEAEKTLDPEVSKYFIDQVGPRKP